MPTPRVASRLAPFGTSIFAEMTALAAKHNAINLSQGFPDFDGPEFLKHAAAEAMAHAHNQYARTQGVPLLNEAIANWCERRWGACDALPRDPHAQITVTSGCTEALAACCLGLLEPGDEVIAFEPFYDAYPADIAMAGAAIRGVPLRPSVSRGHAGHETRAGSKPTRRFAFNPDELRAAFTPRTRAVLLNTPHNPTGKVFTREELTLLAELCNAHNAIVIADEVYERLTFDGADHLSIATLPGMADRTITLSSLGKTFSLTGWKIGWAIAPTHLTAGIRAAHQFLTFATASPLQHAAALALSSPQGESYVQSLRHDYAERRRYLCDALTELGFDILEPEGTYFIMADHAALSARLKLTPDGAPDDFAFCRWLASEASVAAIPPSVFYHNKAEGRRLVRFAFCKRPETLEKAVACLRRALA
ncbi:MAG: aminotransferase class I/II-fold pyridoxal phosphate-dependent enzyme [Phycisphaerales bacterium]|nr:aminotransferase class I/II-fold pyridoxal phosphate-dependent enzyme [Phycisphaerales bacterium]